MTAASSCNRSARRARSIRPTAPPRALRCTRTRPASPRLPVFMSIGKTATSMSPTARAETATAASWCWMRMGISCASGGSKTWTPCTAWKSPMTGRVYVCNRYGNQIRLYDKMGNLKKTIDLPGKPVTVPANGKIGQSGGATVALALSRDAAQTFMFVVNQNNSRIDIIERQTGKILSSLGEIGNLPGQFNQAHSVAVDSQNNLYVVENRGRRIHKFKPVSQ